MKVETQTVWDGNENLLEARVFGEYIPNIAKIADQYRVPVISYSKCEEPEWRRSDDYKERKVLIGLGLSSRIHELSNEDVNYFYYQLLFQFNYPG